MYLCLYHPENGRDTDNVIKWTLSPCYWARKSRVCFA